MIKLVHGLAAVATVVGLSGCATKMGATAIKPDRFNYNQSILVSANEQLLLNLVRMRYRDRPLFLELQSVVSSRTLQGNVAAGATVGIDGSGRNEYPLGASLGYEERPTVTYTPLQGEDFAKRVLTPMVPETILLLSNSGWSIERLFLMCISRLNGIENAPSAAGPTPEEAPEYEEFQELAALMRLMQKTGVLKLQVFQTSEDTRPQIQVLMDLPSESESESNPELDLLRRRLGVTAEKQRLLLTSALEQTFDNELALNPRSLMGVFYYLSQGVEPPPEHEEAGLVTITRDREGNRFDWTKITGKLLRVVAQKPKPDHAFISVKYRGYWFYVEDSDLNSKSTLSLLHFLLSLKSAGGTGRAPILSLPAG